MTAVSEIARAITRIASDRARIDAALMRFGHLLCRRLGAFRRIATRYEKSTPLSRYTLPAAILVWLTLSILTPSR